MRGKLVGLFAVVLLALVCLLGRITYINATSGQKYKKQVLTQAQQKEADGLAVVGSDENPVAAVGLQHVDEPVALSLIHI